MKKTCVLAMMICCCSWLEAGTAGVQNPLPRLKVSGNGRFLVQESGKPFFWLGDTSWDMLQKCRREDSPEQPSIVKYFVNRAAKGFNVLQCKMVGRAEKQWTNAYGQPAFVKGDFTKPAIKPGPDNDYWDMADWFIDQAERHGIYLAILPLWLDLVYDNTPLLKNPDVAYRYGHFLGARYGKRSCIIWVLGGDPSSKHDVTQPERLAMTRALAEGIADGANGEVKFDGRADYSTTLMTFHPGGGGHSSSERLHKEPWLDFNMIQTTTRFIFTNYETVATDYAKTPPRPTLDAEVAYEESLTLSKDPSEPKDKRTTSWEVRKAAYWSVFAGGFGYTYGHRSYIAFCLPGEKLPHGSHIPWFERLDAAGASQMPFLKRLMLARAFLTRIPDQTLIAQGEAAGIEKAIATRAADGGYAMVYIPTGHPVTVKLDKVSGSTVQASWFDPRTGQSQEAGSFKDKSAVQFTPPTHGDDQDWVLVLDDAARRFPPPGKPVQIVAAQPAARDFPPVSELPSRPEFPDPLVMLDGRRVTTPEQWFGERRPELVALFQHYMYGVLPPAPKRVQGYVEREDKNAFKGKATLKEVTIKFGSPELSPLHLMLIVPNRRSGPAPVILSLNYFGNHTLVRDPAVRLSTAWMPARGEGVVNEHATEASRGAWVDRWAIEHIIDRGYGVATCYNGDIDPDRPEGRGLQAQLRKPGQQPGAQECGTIAAWAWGLCRLVDYLVIDKDVNPRGIVVTGHSRLGKAALLAAALDERIAIAIPHQAGAGGSAPSRTTAKAPATVKPLIDRFPHQADTSTSNPNHYPLKSPETVKLLNEKFPHWCDGAFKEFNDHPDRLPFDQHCLVALCAPRPVLFTNGRIDTWINPAGQFEVLRAASPVYRLLKAGELEATHMPPDGKLIDSTLGFFIRPGAHSLTPQDWDAFLDFADKHLGKPGTGPQSK